MFDPVNDQGGRCFKDGQCENQFGFGHAMHRDLPALIGLVTVLAFVLVAMADLSLLAYTPAAFLGAACFFGSGAKLEEGFAFVVLTWVAGVLFGLVSEQLGKRLAKPA